MREARFYTALILVAVWFTLALLSAFPARAHGQCGIASWYGHESGNTTANGERYRPWGLTAAHRTLPFNTIITVTRQDTGRSVTVRINDRGPAAWTGRIIDLSLGAADALGMVQAGVVPVCIEEQS